MAQGSKWLRVLLDNPAPLCSPFFPFAAELALQIRFLLASSRDPSDSFGKGLSSLDPGHEEVAEECYVWVDSDKVFAQMCENCHGQDGVGGEIKEAEPVGVHDVAKELREGRAEPVVEEQREEWVPVRSQSRSGGCACVSVDQKR